MWRRGTATDSHRIMLVDPVIADHAFEGRNVETRSQHKGYVRNNNGSLVLAVTTGDPTAVFASGDKALVTYVAKQASVTQGGATDIIIDSFRNGAIVNRMKQLAVAYLQGE